MAGDSARISLSTGLGCCWLTILQRRYTGRTVHGQRPLCSDLEFQSTRAHFGIMGGPGGFPPGYERRRQNFFGILVGNSQKVHMPHTCPPQAPLNRAHMPREKVHMPTHARGGACVGMCANSGPAVYCVPRRYMELAEAVTTELWMPSCRNAVANGVASPLRCSTSTALMLSAFLSQSSQMAPSSSFL